MISALDLLPPAGWRSQPPRPAELWCVLFAIGPFMLRRDASMGQNIMSLT